MTLLRFQQLSISWCTLMSWIKTLYKKLAFKPYDGDYEEKSDQFSRWQSTNAKNPQCFSESFKIWQSTQTTCSFSLTTTVLTLPNHKMNKHNKTTMKWRYTVTVQYYHPVSYLEQYFLSFEAQRLALSHKNVANCEVKFLTKHCHKSWQP